MYRETTIDLKQWYRYFTGIPKWNQNATAYPIHFAEYWLRRIFKLFQEHWNRNTKEDKV